MTRLERFPGFVRYFRTGLFIFIAYALSSGPVLATAFKLKDWTDRDGFYGLMWIYYPLIELRPFAYICWQYVGWWCHLFGTMPPG